MEVVVTAEQSLRLDDLICRSIFMTNINRSIERILLVLELPKSARRFHELIA